MKTQVNASSIERGSVQSCWKAITTSAGNWAEGDILIKTTTVDESVAPPTILGTVWYNETQDLSPAAAPVQNTDVVFCGTDLVVLGEETLTAGAAAVALTIPAGANHITATVHTNPVGFTVSGTAPVAGGTSQHYQNAGNTFELDSSSELTGFQAIEQNVGAPSTVYVTYYRKSPQYNT